MSKHRHDHPTSHAVPTKSSRRRKPMMLIGLILGAAVCAAVFIWTPANPRGPIAPSASNSPPPAPAPKPPPAPAAASSDLPKLLGKWLRPDGGYVMDVKNVGADGKLEVEYLNPRPIHVARAEAAQDGKTIKLFLELRDTGYPGCTYQLTYDAKEDQLKGNYFQAAIQENFEVVFVRMK